MEDRYKMSYQGKREFDELVRYHDLGVDGDKEAVNKAYVLAKKMYEADSSNHLVQAYYGSATSLLGRDAIDPSERMKLAIQGVKILDNAVLQESQNIDIRVLRGYVCYRLPEMFFHRTSSAIDDFKYIISRYEQDNSIIKQEFYWQVLYDLGLAYKTVNKTSEYEKTWRKLSSISSNPKYHNLLGESDSKSDMFQPESIAKGFKKKITEGIELHSRASLGYKDSIEKAYDFFEKVYKEEPQNTIIAAYYADCLSMKGRDSNDKGEMFANSIKSMKIFDEAVNKSPDSIEVRLLRGNHSFRLPEAFFKRTATAITDFEYLVTRYEQDREIFSKELYYNLLYILGKAYKQMGMSSEAKTVWNKLYKISNDPSYKSLVSGELQKNMSDYYIPDRIIKSGGKALLQEGIKYHDMAVDGDKMASKAAFEILKKAYDENPTDPITEGYYGSSMALAARDSNDPGALFSDTIKGLQHIKHAVSKDMNNPKLRILRAFLTYNLPEAFFQMSDKAAKDFRFLKSAYEQDNSIFSKELYWKILYSLGDSYRKSGDADSAKKIWDKLVKECPDPRYKDLVNKI